MANVKNNHDAALNVAGVDIRPGATAYVDDRKLDAWSTGNAAKIWLEQGLVEVSGSTKKDAKDAEAATGEGLPNGTLIPAGEGGATIPSGTGTAMGGGEGTGDGEIDPKAERAALLEEARALGLNPNANTSTDKLKAMIAEKKGD